MPKKTKYTKLREAIANAHCETCIDQLASIERVDKLKANATCVTIFGNDIDALYSKMELNVWSQSKKSEEYTKQLAESNDIYSAAKSFIVDNFNLLKDSKIATKSLDISTLSDTAQEELTILAKLLVSTKQHNDIQDKYAESNWFDGYNISNQQESPSSLFTSVKNWHAKLMAKSDEDELPPSAVLKEIKDEQDETNKLSGVDGENKVLNDALSDDEEKKALQFLAAKKQEQEDKGIAAVEVGLADQGEAFFQQFRGVYDKVPELVDPNNEEGMANCDQDKLNAGAQAVLAAKAADKVYDNVELGDQKLVELMEDAQLAFANVSDDELKDFFETGSEESIEKVKDGLPEDKYKEKEEGKEEEEEEAK